jgi:transcriptional regulator with XRE-family HTH domain
VTMPQVTDFPALVRWLAKHYHDDTIVRMAPTTGLSQAILDRWSKGQVKSPKLESLDALADAYELDRNAVADLARRWIYANRRRVRRAIATLLVGFALGAAELAHATPSDMEAKNPSYRRKGRHRWWLYHLDILGTSTVGVSPTCQVA